MIACREGQIPAIAVGRDSMRLPAGRGGAHYVRRMAMLGGARRGKEADWPRPADRLFRRLIAGSGLGGPVMIVS